MTDQTAPGIVPDEKIHPSPPTSEKPVDVPDAPDEASPDAKEPEPVAEPKEEEIEPEHRPRSGYARLKARHQAVIQENNELKARINQPVESKEKPPKVEDFNGDYLAFERAAVAYEARAAVRDELGKARQADQQVKAQEAQAENLDDFFERWNDLEKQMPDAKQAVDSLFANIGPLNPVARDLLADADNGEIILYYLAKNPGIARQLNSSDPLSAAKLIGQLEAKTTLPKARTETKAPPPHNVPKGGATPPRDLQALAKKSEDISDYIKARKAKPKSED